MKTEVFRKLIREEVKTAIQEELKDILLEAIRSSKQTSPPPVMSTPTAPPPSSMSKEQLRENYRNILGETAASFNTSQVGKPLQLNGSMDTASPNGKLPEGEVSMDMIKGLLNSK